MTIRQIWRWCFVLLVIALLIILNIDVPMESAKASRAYSDPRVEIPSFRRDANLTAARDELRTTTIWGAAARDAIVATDKSATALAWSLVGVYGVGSKRFVTLSFEKNEQLPQQLAVGDLLPNGGLIKRIERDRVLVQRERDSSWTSINRSADSANLRAEETR